MRQETEDVQSPRNVVVVSFSLICYPRTEISWGPDLSFPHVLLSMQTRDPSYLLNTQKHLRLVCVFFPFLAKQFRKHSCHWHCDIVSSLAKWL